ncbi:Variant-specific surface protein, partial [Giardia duodenalis]
VAHRVKEWMLQRRCGPGSGVCGEARGGACVGYVKTVKMKSRQTAETCTMTNQGQTGNCKTDKCDVTIGGSQYCSQCSVTTEFPINGVCTTDKGTNTNTCDAGKCTSCGAGYFLHKGGCYKKGQQPGQTICKDTADITGKCQACASGYFNNPAATDSNDKESCIACGDTTGADTYKGRDKCATCDSSQLPASGGGTITCTACVDGYFADNSGTTCTQCIGDCQTCKGAATQCTSCKTNYLKITDSAGAFGECVTDQQCTSTHFPTTTTDGKKICTPCSDAANGGIANCKTCSKTDTTVTCSACTPDNAKKPNKAGSKCFDCQLADCSHCSADGVCEACSGNKKVSPGGSSCVTTCPDNSTEKETGACLCNEGYSPKDGNCELASTGPNLSTGAIAGISVAAVVVVGGLVGFLCWWFVCRGKA